MSRGLLAAALAVIAACGNATGSVTDTPSGSSAPSSATVEPSAATGTSGPRTTPPGTPAPIPDIAIATSASIEIPPPVPDATATPAPEPGLWRIDGYVVDEDGKPLPGACVVIGPRGCQKYSPHADDRGYWWIDIAEGQATFDFYFEMPGHKTVWLHVQPAGATNYNVVLTKG